MPVERLHASRLDRRRPLVLDTRDLGRRPGSMLRVHRVAPAPPQMGLELAQVPEGAPIDLDLRTESVMEGVLVSGTAVAPVSGECGRCLEPVQLHVTGQIQELYVYPGEPVPEDEEVGRLDGDLIDLEPAVRDAVVLALPLTPLCRDDCPGLCVDCGERLADDDGTPIVHDHAPPVDPRWASLARFPIAEPSNADLSSREN